MILSVIMKNDKLNKILSDPVAYVLIKVSQMFSAIHIFCCSFITFVIAKIKGIKIDSIMKCNGVPYLFRVPLSEISIGKNAIMNSSFKSNNIGVLSRSRITTNRKYSKVVIGNNVGMSSVTISAFEKIEIGDNTLIGGNVLITDSDWHPLSIVDRHNDKKAVTKPVLIGNNVFVGTRSIILKGSVIGDNSVIGAGSVVSGTIPPNVIACGNPCRVIRSIEK